MFNGPFLNLESKLLQSPVIKKAKRLFRYTNMSILRETFENIETEEIR